jgi:hypothetical protein
MQPILLCAHTTSGKSIHGVKHTRITREISQAACWHGLPTKMYVGQARRLQKQAHVPRARLIRYSNKDF